MSAPVARAGADLRMLRAAVFTAVCVVLSAGGHALASCAPVPLWALGVGCLAVFAVAAPLAGRERSLPGIAVALGVGQLLLHSLFTMAQHGDATAVAWEARQDAHKGRLVAFAAQMLCDSGPRAMDTEQANRLIADAGIDPGAAGVAPPHHAPSLWEALLPSLPMVLGHLLAALAAGWLLRRGEAALWRLARLSTDGVSARALRVALRLVRALRAGLLGGAEEAGRGLRAVRADERDAVEPRSVVLQHSVIRRGPPAVELAA
ncbi:hypothetical protein LRS74_16070 [Streptomyces sp. LX-29]|uniref:hypothetical protein n=1 Tax=Streptomyces sp. LX-29 TaxID=2900152 RepID=UPI00240E103C|nr:hypothetical protein [Streptomyces sp. LX-29]WFB08397.1 hypothetical protein LRS74_16070 [Streptomyces sp. LX-29]